MLAALAPLFGALLAILASLALGTMLLRGLNIVLTRGENRALSFLTGASVLSLAVLGLAALHLIYAATSLLVTALLTWLAWGRTPWGAGETPPRSPRWFPLLFTAIALPFFVLYFFTAWAPEASPDGSSYHLGNVLRLARNHGLVPIPDLYGALPEGLEMLFLFAYPVGRQSSAAVIHFAFLIALTSLVILYARRFGFPKAGFLAALMVFASPLIGRDAASAYTDIAGAAAAFGVVYFVELWLEKSSDSFLIPAGLLSGFSFSIKYTGVVAAVWALLLITFQPLRQKRLPWQPLLRFAAPAAIAVAPWLIKNALHLHNPLSPFFNTLFPNPYISPRFEAEYAQSMATAAGTRNPFALFRIFTLTGAGGIGFLGPAFALAPVGLFALRNRQGRHLLLAALIFALPIAANQDTRFLLPAAPCLALAIAIPLSQIRFAAPAIMLLLGLASWPSVVTHYAEPYAWRLEDRIPVAAAWHRRRTDDYLHQRFGASYDMAKLINQKTPPGSAIFCHSCPQQGYMDRDSLVGYESTLGVALEDMLYAPMQPYRQPRKRITVTFPGSTMSSLRVTLAKSRPTEIWSIHEMRVASRGAEIPRSAAWRFNAQPEPWEAPFAFDGNPATRWSSEQFNAVGAFLEIDFDKPTAIDTVILECASEESEQLAVEADGKPLDTTIRAESVPPPPGLRRAATRELKRQGFAYLLITDRDYFADDFALHPTDWGISQVARVGDQTLFRIE